MWQFFPFVKNSESSEQSPQISPGNSTSVLQGVQEGGREYLQQRSSCDEMNFHAVAHKS